MNTQNSNKDSENEILDGMIAKITVDAYGADEQLYAFLQAFEDQVKLPSDGFVIGEPVEIIAFEYDGNEMRGLTARCRRDEGSEYLISVPDVVLPGTSAGARYIAAYRRWLGLEPYPASLKKSALHRRQHKTSDDDVDLSKPIKLVALSVAGQNARCRLLENERVITLRASRLWDVVPGSIITVLPRKYWRYSGHPYLSGEIQSVQIDIKALNMIPLKLIDMGKWDPKDQYWGEKDEPVDEWVRQIIECGSRPSFEMEQVMPGADSDYPYDDPIIRSNDLKNAGDWEAAENILMELCREDLRCLDAHSHLGIIAFKYNPQKAIMHYEVGFRIGELSLGDDFDGVLSWGLIDNRPFLRCLHGYGLCLWRLKEFDKAEQIFQKMLWLNPSDNQGVRFLIDDLRSRTEWVDDENR